MFRDEHKIILNTTSAIPNFYWTKAKKKKTRRRETPTFKEEENAVQKNVYTPYTLDQ